MVTQMNQRRIFSVENETAQVRILVRSFFFYLGSVFFFFFFFFFFFLFVYVWKCDEGSVHFLHIVAKSPAFPK